VQAGQELHGVVGEDLAEPIVHRRGDLDAHRTTPNIPLCGRHLLQSENL
jgi:hypothetical protein